MTKKVFISYKYEDKDNRHGIEGALNNVNFKASTLSISEEEDLRNQGENVVKSYLKNKINNADYVICLIGQDTHDSKMVDYELDVANSLNKKIYPLRIKGTTGPSPNLIKEKKLKEYSSIKEIQNDFK